MLEAGKETRLGEEGARRRCKALFDVPPRRCRCGCGRRSLHRALIVHLFAGCVSIYTHLPYTDTSETADTTGREENAELCSGATLYRAFPPSNTARQQKRLGWRGQVLAARSS